MYPVVSWVLVASLAGAVVCGALGFAILAGPNRGLAKALFYIFLCTAVVTGLLWLLNRPPETVL